MASSAAWAVNNVRSGYSLLLLLLLLVHSPEGATAQQTAAAVLTACGLNLNDLTAGISNSSVTIPSYPQVLPWAAGATALPTAAPGQLFTLHWIDSAECVPREVARSYAASTAAPNFAWEGVRGKLRAVEPDCTNPSSCTILSQEGPKLWTGNGAANPAVGCYVLDGVTRVSGALSNAEQAARFLATASFGPTMADITALLALHPLGALSPTAPSDDTDTRHFSAWMAQQNALSPTLLRAHLRSRVNTRDRGDEAVVGRLSKPCDIGSRWHRFAFTEFDEQQILTVDRVGAAPGTCYYSLKLQGDVVITHVLGEFDGENCTEPGAPLLRTYRICGVHEQADFRDPAYVRVTGPFPAGSPVDCPGAATHDVALPSIELVTAPDANTTEVFAAGTVTLDAVEAVSGAFIVSQRTVACTGPQRKLTSFMSLAGTVYRLDRRRTLVSNTLASPALITDPAWKGACSDVAPTFVNQQSCALRPAGSTVCTTTTYLDGTSFPLDTAHLRYWYLDSVRYVYQVQNLRVDSFVQTPCTASTISRWIRTTTGGACAAGASTDQTIIDAVRASKVGATNAEILDITISDFGTCSVARGAFVNVDGDCWTHSHPNERDVYDFTQWFSEHEGGPNKIAKWAEAGGTTIYFPASHPMIRWEDNFRVQRFGPHTRLGRFGDNVEFSSLHPSLQTPEMAARVSAQSVVSTQGFMSCGSRGEEAGQPDLGHRFVGTNYRFDQGLDRQYYYQTMGATYVWNNVVLSAQDQLCQRTAWALAQIVVARGDDFLDGNDEPMLAFYDIFIQHCNGNYRDILREVSANPIMARYLTFHGNRAFAVTGTYPDENYAREVMQLFSVGVFELEEDGLESRDAQGNFQLAYTNTDIENGARVWTGWYNRARRGNLLLMSRTQPNYIDPVYLRVDYRDRFPKTKIGGGYLGDGHPLCADLPPRHYLQQGAEFMLTGENSALGVFYDEISGLNQSVARDQLTLTPSSGSALYTALCGDVAGACTFVGKVELPSTLACTGTAECNADTLRTIRVVASSGAIAYYKYKEPVCVYMSFFDYGRIIKNSNWEQCAAEEVALSAGVTCCDSTDISTVLSNGGGECKYLAEPMRYSTATSRCAAEHVTGTICPADSAIMKQTAPIRDGFTGAPPAVPAGVLLRKNGPCQVSGTVNGVTRWRFRLNATLQDHTGLAGPIVIIGRRPDASEREFVIDRVQLFAYQTNYFYFGAFSSQAEYDKFGAAALVNFNTLFPDGTEFRLDRWGFGSDPTGEKGTNDRWAQFCAAWQYQWTTDSCEMTAEIDPEGKVNLVDRRGSLTGSYGHLRYLREGSGNKFYVDWGTPVTGTVPAGEPNYPIMTNGACNAVGCTNRTSAPDSSCICPVHVDYNAVYTSASTNVETADVIRLKLRVGAFAPASYGAGIYTQCTTGPCTAQTDVQVWTKNAGAFDEDAIFVLSDRAGLPADYLKNVESTVVLGTHASDEVQVPLSSCTASSFYQDDPTYQCSNVYDGNLNTQWATNGEGVGSWIDLQFATSATLNSFKFANRCGSSERSRGLRLLFSDMTTFDVVLANNTRCELEEFFFSSTVVTTSVRVTVTAAYEERNNGAREIQFFGPAGPNSLSDPKVFNFRNAPHFVPNAGGTGRTSPDNSPRYALYDWQYHEDKGTDETHALLETLLQHPNTPPMIAIQLIQKLVTSNPSPRYVREVVKAFKTGSYPGMSFSGEYGDLGATMAAVMLDREARVSTLDLDRHHGKVQEPLLKILHMMRSMEYQARPGVQTGLMRLGPKIGQGSFQHPSVFSFFSPFYEPPGPVADAGLVSPEVEILTAPLLIGYLNGMDSLIENGLTNCQFGFGDDRDGAGKRDYCRTSKLDQTDDGRMGYTLPAAFNDIEEPQNGQLAACTASSETSLNPSQACFSALDGLSSQWISYREQEGAWIQIELGSAPVSIDTFKMSNRCPTSLANADVALVFSDGTNMTFTLFDNCTLAEFPLGQTVLTTFVRIVVLSVYSATTTNTYNGAREIEFWMGGAQVTPVACSASSENNAQRSNTCTMSIGSAPYPGWVVQGSGVGSWVQKDFTVSTTIGRVQFAERCGRNRPMQVLLEFSTGSSQTVVMENDCNPVPVPITPTATTFVKATVQSVYNATASSCCVCNRFTRRVNDTAAPSVTCEQYHPGTDAEMRFWNPRDKAGIMDTMGTLLAPGRFSGVSRSVIGDAYERQRTQEDGFKQALKLFMMAPAFNVNNDPAPLLTDRAPYTPVPSQNRPYKAIITIMLAGGADSYNMLVPDSCSPVDLYGEYASIRGPDLTLPRAQLHTITAGPDSHPQPCSTFGLHPSLSYLQQSYNAGECIVFANMGALTEPIASYTEYRSRTKRQPVGNFGHNGMQRNAMSLAADDHLAKGVLGRTMGVLSAPPSSFKSAMYSTASHKKILEGSLTPSIIQAGSGVIRYSNLASVKDDVDALNQRQLHSVFGETVSNIMGESLISTETLGVLLAGKSLLTNESLFGTGGSLGSQLKEVAKLIRVDNDDLNVERSGFIVQQGGYDTHATFDLVPLLDQLNDAIRNFANEMKAQGIWENVAVQVVSDFGRTLTSNSQGTDHAWGGNYFLLGGGVRGGRVMGRFPDGMAAGADLDLGRGRLIATTPWEAPWNGLCEWFDVPASDVDYVLPNAKNFPPGSLYTEADLFGPRAVVPPPPPPPGSSSGLFDGSGGTANLVGLIVGIVVLVLLIVGGIVGVVFLRKTDWWEDKFGGDGDYGDVPLDDVGGD